MSSWINYASRCAVWSVARRRSLLRERKKHHPFSLLLISYALFLGTNSHSKMHNRVEKSRIALNSFHWTRASGAFDRFQTFQPFAAFQFRNGILAKTKEMRVCVCVCLSVVCMRVVPPKRSGFYANSLVSRKIWQIICRKCALFFHQMFLFRPFFRFFVHFQTRQLHYCNVVAVNAISYIHGIRSQRHSGFRT